MYVFPHTFFFSSVRLLLGLLCRLGVTSYAHHPLGSFAAAQLAKHDGFGDHPQNIGVVLAHSEHDLIAPRPAESIHDPLRDSDLTILSNGSRPHQRVHPTNPTISC